MKAEELRLGLYIMDGNDVLELDRGNMECFISGRCEGDPIPLTEEWLIKFGSGAESEMGNYWLGEYRFSFSSMGVLRFHINKKVIYLDYVHQLQNLYFALTGKELIIK